MNDQASDITRNRNLAPAGRLLALDLGAKRTGAALSDEMQITVRPLPGLGSCRDAHFADMVRELVRRHDARAVVIGLPLRMDGSPGDAAQQVLAMARRFEAVWQLPVFTHDERLTSVEAEETERARRGRKRRRGTQPSLDSEAAAIILRDFIAAQGTPAPAPLDF